MTKGFVLYLIDFTCCGGISLLIYWILLVAGNSNFYHYHFDLNDPSSTWTPTFFQISNPYTPTCTVALGEKYSDFAFFHHRTMLIDRTDLFSHY